MHDNSESAWRHFPAAQGVPILSWGSPVLYCNYLWYLFLPLLGSRDTSDRVIFPGYTSITGRHCLGFGVIFVEVFFLAVHKFQDPRLYSQLRDSTVSAYIEQMNMPNRNTEFWSGRSPIHNTQGKGEEGQSIRKGYWRYRRIPL